MNTIVLNKVLPQVFVDTNGVSPNSEIWDKTIGFRKQNNYLIKAASGTGKSSFCSFVYGNRTDYRGKLMFDNQDVKFFSPTHWDDLRCKEISFVFQDLKLFPELTSFENVLLKNNLTQTKSIEEIEILFSKMGISDKRDHLIGKMSFGQQQRVAIIRSLCQKFDFILLDEPISHLDDENADIIADIVSSEAQKQNAGVIVTSIGRDLPLKYNHILNL